MSSFHLFERFGVELEYMIVDADTLDVRPVADRLLEQAGGEPECDEADFGRLSWSNELVQHVIEFKCSAPEPSLDGLAELFQTEVKRANGMLAALGCRLLPTGMHPWMNPHRETKLWPYGNKEIYRAFDRIFDCRGHGWSNLQSTHLNLPFCGDDEFHRLHAAIRLILPLLPALSASTPFADGAAAPALDMRLESYRHNCARVPSVTAGVVPERMASKAEYEEKILGRIYADMDPLDPEGVLHDEWANARGAIARFCRDTIEIRVLDLQECPRADLAIVQCAASVIKALVEGRASPLELQDAAGQKELEQAFASCMREASGAMIDAPSMFAALGLSGLGPMRAREIWAQLLERFAPADAPWREAIEYIIRKGTLAERIRAAAGPEPTPQKLRGVYMRLADCLSDGTLFS
ncbi:MAG: glutamate-cysteine ligase family protein [Opitutales bacterium]|jgi:gamma-glutamyl:cysteine ligase YbdK (ATP-grasp superfamily)